GEIRHAEQPRERPHVRDHRVDLLRPDDRDRNDRSLGADRGRDETAAAEAAEPVAVFEALAGATRALGKDEDELIPLEQATRIVRMPDRLTRPAQKPAERRHAHELAGHQRPYVARPRMLDEDGGLDHRAVPREDAGMI